MKFFVKDFCETVQARVVIFGMQVDNDVLYRGIANQPSPAHSSLYLSNFLFSSPEHKVLKVSYCDHPVSGVRRQSSVVRRPSCVVNNSFKAHLLLNYWTNFKIISHKCSPEAPLPKLLKWFCSAEQNGRQS